MADEASDPLGDCYELAEPMGDLFGVAAGGGAALAGPPLLAPFRAAAAYEATSQTVEAAWQPWVCDTLYDHFGPESAPAVDIFAPIDLAPPPEAPAPSPFLVDLSPFSGGEASPPAFETSAFDTPTFGGDSGGGDSGYSGGDSGGGSSGSDYFSS